MKAKTLLLGLIAAATLSCSMFAAQPMLRDGERVVFLGDSITEQRLYTTYLEAYALTRYPGIKLTFRNVGWGGDTSWLRQRAHPDEGKLFAATGETLDGMVQDAVKRGLERDVLPLQPTVVTINFGMNDHSYQPFREDIFRAYKRSQAELVRVLKANGAGVALFTPQPIEDKRPDPDKDARNQSLRRFSDGLQEVAEAEGALFVDEFDPYMKVLLKERAGNPPTMVGGGDAVHPGPIGHTLMAWAILTSLHAPALVSSIQIDAAAGKETSTDSCSVSKLQASKDKVSFDRTDEALPFPLDPRAEAVLKLAPVLDDLSVYELKVTGLTPGTYTLKIDDETAGRASAAQLEKGWNISNTAGPITKQVREVLGLVFKKNDLFFNRWRNVQLYEFPSWAKTPANEELKKSELAKLDRQVAEMEEQIDAARRVKPHHFELTRTGE